MQRLIDSGAAAQRADRYLRKILPGAPLSFLYKLFRRKDVRVNGRPVKGPEILNEGDILTVYLSAELEEKWAREEIPCASGEIHLLYEDEEVLLLYKPAGLKTTPDVPGEDALAVRAQHYLRREAKEAYRPSPISRLDRNTSGLVLFAKTYEVMKNLQEQQRRQGNKKYYLALIFGTMNKAVLHSMGVKRDATERISRSEKGGKIARTALTPLARSKEHTLVEAQLLSGRTHQIRLALSDLGTPIVGDPKYGGGAGGQFLHAYRLETMYGAWTYLPAPVRQQIEKEFPDARVPADNCTMRTLRL